MSFSHIRNGLLTTSLAGALVVLACSSARADIIVTETVTENPSGSDSNVTNGHVLTVFTDTPAFAKFDSMLGTLISATLSWSATGSLTVTGNNEGQAIMSYATSADTETWNIFGGQTTLNFSISGSEALTLSDVTGTGNFNEGPFAETYQLQQGFFPDMFSTGATAGTFTVKFDYTVPGPPPPPPPVPEPAGLTYFTALSLGALVLYSRARRKLSE